MSGPRLRSLVHGFEAGGQSLLFHPESMHLWAVSDRIRQSLDTVDGRAFGDAAAVLSGQLDGSDVTSLLARLEKAGMLAIQAQNRGISPDRTSSDQQVTSEARRAGCAELSHLVLYVSQDCNLACRYCLTASCGELGAGPMSEEVAAAAIDLLFARCGGSQRLTVAFYGGEPLLELGLIEQTVDRCRALAAGSGRTLRFSITTNGTLLSERACELLAAHGFSVQISLDPDPGRQDRDRPFADGSGSFRVVAAGINRLLAHDVRVVAKVVAGRGVRSLVELSEQLAAIGIREISLDPALSLDGGAHRLGLDHGGLIRLQLELLEHLACGERQGRSRGRSIRLPARVRQRMKALSQRRRIGLGCDAGRGRLAIAADGRVLACESCIGVGELEMGNVLHGLQDEVAERLARAQAAPAAACRSCWARTLCNGPCALFSFRRFGELSRPVEEQCRLVRAEAEAVMACYHLRRSQGAAPASGRA